MFVTLNIGLNVGKKQPKKQELKTLNYFRPVYYRKVAAEYNGIPEESMVICVIWNKSIQELFDYISNACLVLSQECIAISIDFNDYYLNELIYSPFFSGKRMQFNKDYFHSITLTGKLKF
jgi:hypothetical protein